MPIIPLTGTTGRHYQHVVIRFLPDKNMNWNLIKIAPDMINSANFKAFDMTLDLITLDVLGPIPPLLNQGRNKDSPLLPSSSKALKSQKLLSRAKILAMWKKFLQIFNNKPVFAPSKCENSSGLSLRQSLPSTNSRSNKIRTWGTTKICLSKGAYFHPGKKPTLLQKLPSN